MHRFLLPIFSFILFIFCLALGTPVFAVSYSSPTGYVNDTARMYSETFRQSLEQDLAAYEKQTTVEMAVVTILSLEDEPIEDYAVELFRRWKIGQKGQDNGLLLLISKNDQQMRI